MSSLVSVLIIDDETPAREIIKRYLQEYDCIHVVGEADNGFDALKMIREQKPQLIFLDIQMPKLTGFEMLELIDNLPEVIFSTAFDEYAIRAFEQNVVDYLLKPYAKERFDMAMKKAIAKISAPTTQRETIPTFEKISEEYAGKLTRIAVKNRQQIHVIPIQNIDYIEANGDYVCLHTGKEVFLKEKTMKFFEENLPEGQFIRIHRSFIVNVNEVAKIELYDKDNYRVFLKNGKMLKASNNGYKALKNTIQL